jgi:HD-GYP domain-containing protein (c-di-GMP phosphodiesterase class II)
MSPEEAVERIQELGGTVLDPTVFNALAAVVSRRHTLVFLDDNNDTPE